MIDHIMLHQIVRLVLKVSLYILILNILKYVFFSLMWDNYNLTYIDLLLIFNTGQEISQTNILQKKNTLVNII